MTLADSSNSILVDVQREAEMRIRRILRSI